MTLIATVRNNETKEISNITSEYNTKQSFRNDLNRNGYTVIGRIENPNENNKNTKRYNLGCR